VKRRGDSVGNTVNENSSVCSPQSEFAGCRQQGHAGSKTLHRQNPKLSAPQSIFFKMQNDSNFVGYFCNNYYSLHGFDSRPFRFQLTTLGNLFTHTRASVTKQYSFVPVKGAVMPCGWEGNRRSGVALAMRHRLQWFVHLRAHGLDREMSTPTTLSCGVSPIFLFSYMVSTAIGPTQTKARAACEQKGS